LLILDYLKLKLYSVFSVEQSRYDIGTISSYYHSSTLKNLKN